MISNIVQLIFRFIYLAIILVCILSWIPNINARKEPVATLVRIFDAIMRPFRMVIPPIAGLDFTPILAFIVLQILEKMIIRLLLAAGL